MNNKLIILDRDGVLNPLQIFGNFDQLDSPQDISQIGMFPWVPGCIKNLNDLGYDIAVATNQPAAAKLTNNIFNLKLIHNKILNFAQSSGGKIISSNICFHANKDNCECRKPKTGMLENAFKSGIYNKDECWMVGDRATDIMAGKSFGIKTALLGPSVENDLKFLEKNNIIPDYKSNILTDFVEYLQYLQWDREITEEQNVLKEHRRKIYEQERDLFMFIRDDE